MASNYKVASVDFDDIFKSRSGGDPQAADTGFKVASVDLAARFYPSQDSGDRIAGATNYHLSNNDDLRVVFRDINYVTIIIDSQPSSLVKQVGDSATFSVTAHDAHSDLTYQWRKAGVNIGGETGTSLTINPTVLGDAGSYTCLITCTADSTTLSTNAVTLHFSPKITGNPTGGTLIVGNVLNLAITATGESLSFQWRQGGTPIGGATVSTYTHTTTATSDTGNYDCVVTNAYGNATSSAASVTVNAFAFTTQPTGGSINVTNVLSLTVAVTGAGSFSYQWYKNASSLGASNGAQTVNYSYATTLPSDSGDYFCRVSNAYGTIDSSTVTVTVSDIAPTISGGTINGGNVGPLDVGNTANYYVYAAGTNLLYEWFKDNVSLGAQHSGSSGNTVDQGPYISPLVAGDVGAHTYKVTVTNAAGNVSVSSILTVQDTLIVINDAASSVQTAGYDYSFGVGAGANCWVALSAGTNVTYQWYKNASPIAYYTVQGPVFTVASGDFDDVYSVTCTNGRGSASASLTI